ncbi:RsmB/NOP family class I SAM-dependent RNA methyltransferase [Alicyclobacillus sp. ALC3]|uniref:RsmB/NOP family class I SAM-dependent RNA methyltransferase n=1 Tax=Alicyclobacillus sp. ALC3 TaxID=2796143 RepID=UPI002379202E|nr:RsmB/NOP family class I SAM-dependent RNA methyltransferase [Alicyclobacillus sp. ALC3]WDL96263.1 RsmF rRNA methyltransferase first C-terminal domain-containing protein [Alicyclobacillus sp. ALC3]
MSMNSSPPPLPPGFVAEMDKRLGTEWPELRDALDATANRAVRLHRVSSKNDPGQFLPIPAAIAKHLGPAVPWTTDAFYISQDAPLGKLVYHELGAYYLQEPSAMAVVEALAPRPGERVLDLCAAPGGKTTAIGRRMQSTAFGVEGLLVANEIHQTRVRILGQNLERLGVAALVTNESPDRLATAWQNQFDAILVDAPCSGEGMFRKDPDARLEWSVDSVTACALRQRDILQSAVRMLRKGGRLVYSTCTFNPEENEQTIAWLRDNFDMTLLPLPTWPGWDEARPDWADGNPDLANARRLWPYRGRGEGHFVALLQKEGSVDSGSVTTDGISTRKGVASGAARLSARETHEWTAWLRETTRGADLPEAWQNPRLVGNALFTDQTGALPLDGLRVLRPGVCIATRKGVRFEPHHQWAMSVQSVDPINPLANAAYSLNAAETCQFITGQALPQTGATKSSYVWVHLNGLPAGWAKQVPGRVNNLYPKGLRRVDLLPE